MFETRQDLCAKVMEVSPQVHVNTSHCLFNRMTIPARRLLEVLNIVIKKIIQIVYLTKAR
jgi:hypothetical protein